MNALAIREKESTNNMLAFVFNDKQIRALIINDEPWFVAKDVCDILEVGNSSQALSRLDDDEKNTIILNEGIGNPEKNIVNEPGLYSLILSSRKPEARLFKRWVTHEVLPSIRKTGKYNVPKTYKEALLALVAAEEEKERLQAKVEQDKPKVEFFEAVASSKDAIEIGQAAKVLNFGKGRNTLFRILREERILMYNNVPYQEYIDRGYFRTIEQKYTLPSGETRISIKTLVYQKGLQFIKKILDRKVTA